MGEDGQNPSVWLPELHQGANECEISDVPKTYPDGQWTFRARILYSGDLCTDAACWRPF